MIRVGLDIGSRAIKLVARDESGDITARRIAPTGISPEKTCRGLLGALTTDEIRLAVTGYGRKFIGTALQAERVETEISALARAAAHLAPEARGLVDVGGHDTKALVLDAQGRVKRFRLSDRCASGTGRFLEGMAAAVGLSIEEFAHLAEAAPSAEPMSSVCVVFAESEMVTKLAAGSDPAALALGAHEAVAERIAGLARLANVEPKVLLTGGGALNPCLVSALCRSMETELIVPENPAFVCALGAVLGLD